MVYAGPFTDPLSPFSAKLPLLTVTAHPGSNPAVPLVVNEGTPAVIVTSSGATVWGAGSVYGTKVGVVPESEVIVNENPEIFCPTVLGPASMLVRVSDKRLVVNTKSAFAL